MLLRQEVIMCRGLQMIVVSIINTISKAIEGMKKVALEVCFLFVSVSDNNK